MDKEIKLYFYLNSLEILNFCSGRHGRALRRRSLTAENSLRRSCRDSTQNLHLFHANFVVHTALGESHDEILRHFCNGMSVLWISVLNFSSTC